MDALPSPASRPLAGDGIFPDLYADSPIVVSYGLGWDSTAMLGALKLHGVVPSYIMFADVGSEHDETYDYMPIIQQWLASVGFPPVVVVRYRPRRFKYGPYVNIWENCVRNATLPSLAFGRKGCSLKWKAQPMDKHLESLDWVRETFDAGKQVQRLIGYDCGCQDLKRFAKAAQKVEDGETDPHYHYVYPLQSLGFDRIGCAAFITKHMGIPLPHKSSCFFCPAMKPDEVRALPQEKLEQIVIMEALAAPNLQRVEGLWRKATKKRPGRMSVFIRDEKLLPEDRWIACNSQPQIEVEKYLGHQPPRSYGPETQVA